MRVFIVTGLLVLLSLSIQSQPDTTDYYASPRLDYYTNEEVGEIMVFVPGRLKNNEISVDLVFEFEFLNRGFKVVPGAVSTVPFEMKRLRTGDNEITVSFYEDEKWIDSRKVYLKILPHHDNAIKIDRSTGGLFVSGLPFIPFGFYTYFPVQPQLPAVEAVNGFNLISPYQNLGKKALKARKAYMDRCADLGIKVNYNVCSAAGGGGVASSQMTGLSDKEKMDMLKSEIEMFRDHPALLSWYIADEPDGRELSPDSLVKTYQLIKELDPYHPVTLVLSSPRNAGDYKNVADILMTDPYPVPQGRMLEVKEYVTITKTRSGGDKPVWAVPQAFGGNEWWTREPNAKEVRAMTYMALISGATGIQYFIRNEPNSFPKSTATWGECGALAMEVGELTADILSPHPAPVITTSDPAIHARAWNRRGLVTIAVVNEKNEPAAFSLKMDGVTITITADVMFENRKTVIVDGEIKDMIDGYGTKVYRFDARQKTGQEISLIPSNLSVDGGFEDLSSPGVPSACYAYPGEDQGCTYFTDPRRHYEGDHSLRMNNPSSKPGNRLCFYGIEASDKKSYTVSIMARTGPSSNKPGGKKGGPVQFRLGFGQEERIFDCAASWQLHEINGIRPDTKAEGNSRVSPALELTNKGTAWFDMLQVYPDMALIEGKGPDGITNTVAITCIHPDAAIYYSLDGSEPTVTSLLYSEPVAVKGSVILKAVAYKAGMKVGYIVR